MEVETKFSERICKMTPETTYLLNQIFVYSLAGLALLLLAYITKEVAENYFQRNSAATVGEYVDYVSTAQVDPAAIDQIGLPESKFAIGQGAAFLKAREIAIQIGATTHDFLTADTVADALEAQGIPASTLGPTAGNIFRNRKLFRPTGLYARSKRPSNRGRAIQIWHYIGAKTGTVAENSN
jgi:hypothetical protein